MILASITLLVVTAGITAVILLTTRSTSPIPADIRNQLTFSPFVISEKYTTYKTGNYRFTAAENNTKILSYVITTPDTTVSLSEYPLPSEFTDIPEYKDRFLTNVINQYATVSSSNGTIYLGRSATPDKKQLGVMLERGLLLFMNPDRDMTEQQWRELGERLDIYKVI